MHFWMLDFFVCLFAFEIVGWVTLTDLELLMQAILNSNSTNAPTSAPRVLTTPGLCGCVLRLSLELHSRPSRKRTGLKILGGDRAGIREQVQFNSTVKSHEIY